MRRIIYLCCMALLFLPIHMMGQEYVPLTVSSGFNEDVIAEDSPAVTFTSTAVDATGSGANNVFMSIDYPGATVGLPANGLINSIATATPELVFQLAPYDDDNVLRINENGGEGTLVFANPQSALQIFVLATSGSDSSNFTGVITFTDDSTQAISSQTIPDWYQTGTNPAAIQGIGRVSRGGGSPDNDTSNPKLFQVPIAIEIANQTKLIESISFTKTSSDSGYLNIFGVSAEITPDCPKPTDFTMSGVSAGGATFSWADVGTDFELKYGPTGFDVETAGTSVDLTNPYYYLTDVTEGQTYDVYVRRDCDADGFSNWTGPITFTAENTITIGDGTDTGSGATTIPVTNFNYNYSQQLVTASEYAAGGGVTGPITKMRYYVTNVGTSTVWNNWTVYIGNTTKSSFDSTTDWIPVSELTEVFSGTITAVANEWFEITFSEPFEYTGDNIVVAVDENTPGWSSYPTFLMYTSTENSGILYRSDTTNPDPADPPTANSRQSKLPQIQFVGTLASCLPPSDLFAIATSFTDADVSWGMVGSAVGYEYAVTTSATPPASGTAVTGTSALVSDLIPDTTYYLHVRTNCGSNDYSSWATTSFYTGYCIPEGTSSSYRINGVSTDGGWTNISNMNNGTANPYSNYSAMSVSQSPGGTIDYTVNVPGSTGIKIWIDLNQNLVFDDTELVASHTSYMTAGNWTGTITLPVDIPEGDYRIRIRSQYYSYTFDPCGAAQYNYGEAEDYTLSVVPVPDCLPPMELDANNITFDTADLSWTADGDLFDIEIVEVGEEPTGTPTETGVSNPHTAEGLDPSTTYEYYVRQDCGEEDGLSMWAGPFSFITTQIPAELNYEQDFEGTHGWALNNGDQTNQWVVGSATGNTGSSLYISNDGGTTNTYNHTLSVVQAYRDIAVPAGTFMGTISFDWKGSGESCCDYFRVWLVPTAYVPTAGTQITSGSGGIQIGGNFNMQSDWQQYLNDQLDLSSFAGSTMRLVFEWKNDGSIGTTTPAGAIDNIEITIPACPQPMNLGVTNITKESADLSWTSIGDTFDIKWEEAGFDVETEGTLVEGFANGGTLSDLASTTDYEFYVRQDCDGDGVSEWSGPYAFTTLCDYPDFEVVTEGEDLLFCGSGSVEIEVDSDGTINWYDAEDALVPVFMGTTYETEILNETTSFWVESATIQEGQNIQLGEGTSTDNSSGSPFYHLWGGYKYQYIYTAEELNNAGLFEGPISALAFDVTQAGTVNYNDFTIAIGTTEQSVATSTHISGLTQVYSNTAQATPVGTNYYEFDNDFEWDGISNIVVQVNWSNNNTGNSSASARVRTHTTSSSQTTYTYADNRTAAQILATMTGDVDNGSGSTSGGTSTTTRRPNTYFNGTAICKSPREEVVVTISESDPVVLSEESLETCPGETTEVVTITEGLDNYDTYEWSPAEGVSGDETTGWTFTAEETTTFTLTASQSEGACTQTVTVEVEVNPLPVAADLEEEYVVCPETVQAISTGLSTDGADGYDVVWAPFDNLYLDATATTAYNGESAGTVYFFSADAGDTTYEVTATSSKGCESTFETAVSVPEVVTPDIEDVYLCVPTSVEDAVESTLNLVWFDSLDSETPIDEFATTGTYYVMNEVESCQSERVAVEVTVVGVNTPTTTESEQQFCDSATIEDILVNHTTGSTLNVYESATGGTALSEGAALYTGTFYIAEQIGDCESDRLAVQITVTQTPPAVGQQTVTICGFEVLANVEIGQQPNAELVWYANETTSQPMNANSQVYAGTYYASQRIGICESARTAITFIVNETLPQPTASSQTFCGSAVVSDLVVTGAEGAMFRWFDSATSTTPLAGDAALSNGTYYVSQELNGCESNRKAISVQIVNTVAPQIANMNLCEGTTIGEVEIPATTGITYKWYVSPTAITALPESTILTNGVYYISSVYSGCESERVVVDIEIAPVPDAPTGEAEQAFVYNISIDEITIADLVVNEEGVLWFAHADDAATLTNPLQSDMPLANNTTYYAVLVSDNGCVSEPFAVTVTVTLGNAKFDRAKLVYYPNPTQGMLTIQYTDTIESVEIYNAVGQLVGTQEFNNNQITVDMSGLSNGTYLLKLHIDGYQQLIKVVKN